MFFKSAGKLGIGLMTGGLAAYSVAAYEHVAGRSLSGFVWVTLGIALFMVGAFLAWNEQFSKAMLAGNPELCIEYERTGRVEPPPLIIRSLGGGNAYRVKIRDLSNGTAAVIFSEVSHIESRQSAEAIARFDNFALPSHFFASNLQAFLMTMKLSAGDIRPIEQELPPQNVRVSVDYFNVSDMRFTAEYEIRATQGWEEVHAFLVRRYFNPR